MSSNPVLVGRPVHALLGMLKRITQTLRIERVFDGRVTHGEWKDVPSGSSGVAIELYSSELSESSPVGKAQKKVRKKEGTMPRLQAFQIAARRAGFIEVSEAGAGSTLWLRKGSPDTAHGTFERMCIDSITNSATVYWMTALGKLDSKTFRGVPALQEWFNLRLETIVLR